MPTPMEIYLNALISEGEKTEGGGIAVQIVFKPGAGVAAGGLRRARMPGSEKIRDGLYELVTAVKPGPDAPLEVRKLDNVMIREVFAADAVQRVVTQVQVDKPSNIIASC